MSGGDLKGRVAQRNREANRPDRGREEERQAAGTKLVALIERQKPEIGRALPKHMDPDRLARIATTLLRQKPELWDCDAQSFLGALMTCAQLGLEPGPLGHAYIIPRWNKKTRTYDAQFYLGYKGMVELAQRSGKVRKVTARTVYANEVARGLFTVEYGSEERIFHSPIVFGDRGEPVGYYAIVKLTSGEDLIQPLSVADVEYYRRRSQTPNEGPWVTDYEPQAHKTCVRRLERWMPMSPEYVQALAQEGRTRTDVSPAALDGPPAVAGEVVTDDQPATQSEPETPHEPSDETAPRDAPPPPAEYACNICGVVGEHYEDECPATADAGGEDSLGEKQPAEGDQEASQ